MAAWCACLHGSTALYRLELGHFNDWCGRWGCLPPTAGLLGMHAFWLTLLSPLPIVVGRLRPAWTKRAGAGLIGLGLLLVIAVCVWAVVEWWPIANHEWLQLLPFSVVRQTDLPAIQLCLVGGAMLCMIRRRSPTVDVTVDGGASDSAGIRCATPLHVGEPEFD